MPYEQLFDGTFVKNARSGFGLEYWLPKHPKSLDKIDTNLNDPPAFFNNMGVVAAKLVESEGSGILIWGEPGAGNHTLEMIQSLDLVRCKVCHFYRYHCI